MEITIRTLSPELLNDYLNFFDNIVFTDNPDWSVCYCFSFHFTGKDEEWNKEYNRQSVIKYINEGEMAGYLAYSDGKPVGWCNVNNRSNFQRLMRDSDFSDSKNDKVCSIVCFLISPNFRRKGIAKKLLQQICTDYALKKYDYIEAYPRKGEFTCEGHYAGHLSLYEKFDFKIEKDNGNDYVVRKKLN